jgi:AcrR family transcriptional regulator
LTARQREVLDVLEGIVIKEGLADRTMAQIAARVSCSLRTLYDISPSRDELLLGVVDRHLHRVGRKAMEVLDPDLEPLEVVRRYLNAVNRASVTASAAFSVQFSRVTGAREVLEAHESYIIAVTAALLDRAVAGGAIAGIDSFAYALALGRLGRQFLDDSVAASCQNSPTATIQEISETILRGLEAKPT